MSEDANSSQPDIVVDDDWKAQVEKEKEALQNKNAAQEDAPQSQSESFEMPPASFMVLMSTWPLSRWVQWECSLIPAPER